MRGKKAATETVFPTQKAATKYLHNHVNDKRRLWWWGHVISPIGNIVSRAVAPDDPLGMN